MINSHDTNPSLLGAAKRSNNGLTIYIYVIAGAKRSAIIGIFEDRIKLAVQKKAVDGAANEAIRQLLADVFGLSKSRVNITKGEKSRQKTIFLDGDGQALFEQLVQVLSERSS